MRSAQQTPFVTGSLLPENPILQDWHCSGWNQRQNSDARAWEGGQQPRVPPPRTQAGPLQPGWCSACSKRTAWGSRAGENLVKGGKNPTPNQNLDDSLKNVKHTHKEERVREAELFQTQNLTRSMTIINCFIFQVKERIMHQARRNQTDTKPAGLLNFKNIFKGWIKQMQSYSVTSEVGGKYLRQPPWTVFRKGGNNRSQQGITSQSIYLQSPYKCCSSNQRCESTWKITRWWAIAHKFVKSRLFQVISSCKEWQWMPQLNRSKRLTASPTHKRAGLG